jgi:hypothetical protein
MKTTLMALAVIALTAGPALAFQCPSLIKQIQDQTANRLDNGANAAKALVQQSEQLHKDGKHAESVAKAEEAAAAAGIKLTKK